MSKPSITVFFPVYNDENTVENLTLKAIEVLEEIASEYEVIIVNDGSPDRSGAIAEELAKKHSCVKVLHHATNKGYGAAIRTGFNAAKFEWIFQTDGDFEYDIVDIKKMVRLLDFYDLIITFRYVKLYSNWRIFVSTIYNQVCRWVFRTNFRDISTGMRLIRKNVFDELTLVSTSPFIGAEIAFRTMLKGYRVGEMGIQTFPREFGSGSSTSWKNILLTVKDMRKVHSHIFSAHYELPSNRKR